MSSSPFSRRGLLSRLELAQEAIEQFGRQAVQHKSKSGAQVGTRDQPVAVYDHLRSQSRLIRLIQTHKDPLVVERLRLERARRKAIGETP